MLHRRGQSGATVRYRYCKAVIHVLNLLNHALGEHRQGRQSETPNVLLGGTKMRYILPAPLYLQDGRVKRRVKFASAERGVNNYFAPVTDEIHPPGFRETQ